MPVIKSSHRKCTDNILYELLVYSEWKQEPDVTRLSLQHQTHNGRVYSLLSALWHPLRYFRSNPSLADDVTKLKNYQLPWQFAVGEEGKFIAILQETQLEIRTSRDEYSSVIGKATLAKDVNYQWRRIVWSPDCSMLAVGASNGSVAFYDLLGSNVFNIPPAQESQQWSCDEALAAIFFITTRVKSPKWLSELVLVDYGGRLRSYYISASEGCLEFHQSYLNRNGVSSVTWHPTHNLLIVSSVAQHTKLKEEGLGWGLSAWRLLNDYPYYRMVIPSPEQLALAEGKLGLWNWFASLGSTQPFSVVFKMQASPRGGFLACVHTCGTISIWELPSLRLHRLWSLIEQPAYNVRNPANKKKIKNLSVDDYLPLDLNWWSEKKIIISRKSGAVSVCNIDDLQNMLGESPEFLCGAPRLSTICSEQGFLALECELVSVKRGQQGFEPEENCSSDEETSFVNKSTALLQSTLFVITDIESFQPKRKRTKALQRTYRLLGLKSTTPEELYNRKIDSEEYGEALALAQSYNLDIDRVFQRQWRNNPVSVGSIYDYLSKVSKTSWVLHECCERVPETLKAAKELIKYGLKCTHVGMVAKELLPEDNPYEDINDCSSLRELEVEILCEKVMSTPVDQLSEVSKLRISTRKKLLRYSDILFTYELILDGIEDNFDRDFYDKFRREPPILSAIQFARAGNDKAVELLLTYLGDETLPHWLTILNNFPETTNPDSYRSLLPECTSDGDLFPWEQLKIREKDWCENERYKNLVLQDSDEKYELPEPHESMTPKLLEQWYLHRIYEVELYSRMIDQALELAKLARERNIKGLEVVYNELILLDVLVYDVGLENTTLSHLEKLTPLQKVQVLMSMSTEEVFVEDMKNRLVPYLLRCDKLVPNSRQSLLKQFMLKVSEKDLSWTLKLFESQPLNSIVPTIQELIELAVECIYMYKETDQFDKAAAILKCIPEETTVDLKNILKDLYKSVNEAESELNVANILSQYNSAQNLEYLHNHRNDAAAVENLLLRIARSTSNKIPPASDADWKKLLADMLEMQKNVFKCIPLTLCYELYASSMLVSGHRPVIRSAVRILCCHSEDHSHKQLSLERSISLVLQAAREYCDGASSITDKGIDLAKACLHLITEENSEIQKELDLISSLQILNEFRISLLVIQVRISPDRLRFIDACLHARPTAYRETQKLLSLANKLHIFGTDKRKREGVVLVRIAKFAFEMKDYHFCADICYRLMDDEQSMGWEVAQCLGQCKEFPVLAKRQRLIAFALLHCPVDNIQELMDTRCELEYEMLQRDIGEQMNKFNTSFDEEEYLDALTTPETPTQEFLPQLTTKLQNTSNLLARFATTDFWKDKFKLGYKPIENKIIDDNSGMAKLGFPSFYVSLHPNCHESQISATYDSFNTNDVPDKEEWRQLRLTQALLQSALLEQEKMPQNSLDAMDEALVQCSRLIFPEDCPLALSYLLSLSNQSRSKQCFSSLPDALLSLQLGAYFYALSDAVAVNTDIIYWKPDQVLTWALQNEQKGECYELLKSAMLQLTNYEQRKKIEQLNCGVNVKRFTSDLQYKHDSILGLAMSEELDKLEVAFELAVSHGVPEFEVALSHITALFLSTNFQLVMERMADNRFSMLLKEQPIIVLQRLKENVWSNIMSTNYPLLITYFSVLQLVIEDKEIDGLAPRDHIKLIKKVKATSTEIDYKKLVTQPQDLLATLRPAFNKDNITSIAKLLKTLPNHIRSCLPASQLYSDWIVIQFKSQCLNSDSSKRCLKVFEHLCGYYSKLTADDILRVIHSTIFCHQSAQQLEFETREQMLTIVLQFCQNQNNNKEWSTLLATILRLKQHLLEVSSLQTSFPPEALSILVQLDIACEDEVEMCQVLDTAVMTIAIPLTCLQTMVKLLPSQESISPFITRLLKSSHVTSSNSAHILLMRVEECLNTGVRSDEWSTLVEPLAKSVHLESQVRLKAVQLLQRLEHSYSGEVESCRLISEAILSRPIEGDQVCDATTRAELFNQLLNKAKSWEELSVLLQLVTAWPQSDNNLYLDLVTSMVKFKSEQMLPTLKTIFKQVEFSEEAVQELVTKLDGDCDVFAVITICLLVKYKTLQEKAIDLFNKLPENVNLPSSTSRLLVEAGLTASIINCPLYIQFVETLLNEDDQLCQSAGDQLLSANHVAEAGTLFLLHSAVPAALTTFSTAVNILSRQS